MTGKPGVMGINKGPGVGNIAAGAVYLAKENIPAVFIMARRQRIYEQRVRRGKMQYLSQPPIFAGVMKYMGTIEYPEQVDEIVQEAFRQALSGVPGPTFVEMPLSIMQPKLLLPPAPPPSRYRLVDQEASAGAVAEAVAIIKAAKNPVVLIGQGAMVSRAHQAVAALASKLGCPIIYSSAVEAVIEGMDARSFQYGSIAANQIVADADAVVAIGTELGETLHYGRGHHWKNGHPERKWIYIERDPTAIGVNRPIDAPLVGDLRAIVPQLTAALGGFARDLPAAIGGLAKSHAAEKKVLEDSIPTASKPIHPGRLAIEASKALPADSVFVRDGGASGMWFSGLVQFTPRDAMWNSNYGAVGPGLPYAVGAQLAVGDKRRVVLVTGDSSILFHISELETAARENLPLVCIVAVDHAWGIEVASYKANFGDNTSTPGAKWNPHARLDKTAESFGAHGEFVERAEDIGPAVERALASGKPALIHVEIDAETNSSFAAKPGIPGFVEFRTWHGEEGDNLGFAGTPPCRRARREGRCPGQPGQRLLTSIKASTAEGPRAILRVPEVLAALAEHREGPTLAGLCKALALPKSSMHRMMATLERGGYVTRERGIYRLGPQSARLAQAIARATAHSDLPRLARPCLEELARETGESVMLGVLDASKENVCYIDVINSTSPLHVTVPKGNLRPLYSAAAGKVLLASQPRELQ